MILRTNQDAYGRNENLTADNIRHILNLIDGYMTVPYTIHEIRQDDIKDPHGRIDIEVRFVDEKNHLIQQKLLILDDELIDGETFHKRFKEWYS